MIKKTITIISFLGLTLPVHFAFSQIIEPVALKSGESTQAVIQHPVGVKKYVELKYQVHCAADLNAAGEVVSKKGGIAIGPNSSIIVENKSLTRRNHSGTVIEITCFGPLKPTSNNLGQASARSSLPVIPKSKYVLPEIDPTPVVSGRHLVPEFEFKNKDEVLKVQFALHCSRSGSLGSNAVMYSGGISISENSMVVIEDKFNKNKESVDNISLVKCDEQTRENTESVITVE